MNTVLEYGSIYGLGGAHPSSTLGEYERQWLDNLKVEISNTSAYPINIVINLTWLEPDERLLSFIFDAGTKENTKLWFTGTVDGTEWFHHTHSFRYIKLSDYTYEFVGNSNEHFHTWIPSLLIKNNDLTKVNLNESKYLFLSYNRKPRVWREQLVTQLIKNNLHNAGYITFEAGVFPEIDMQTATHDQDLHTNDIRFSRPEDILTLGNLDIWNNSYSVIVSETEISDSCQISEKTWKPIMGLRPYFLNSNPGVARILDRLGFCTPGKLFDNPKLDDCSITEIIDQLKLIKNPDELYKTQLEMLTHNQNRFIEIANSDPSKILNWPQ